MPASRSGCLTRSLATIALIFSAGILALTLFRVAFLLTYAGTAATPWADLPRAFAMGARADAKVTAVFLLPAFGLALLALLFPARFGKRLHRLVPAAGTLAFAALAVLATINHFYYRNFQSSIDVRAFGLVDDGFREVMASVWTDYPVVTGVIGVGAACVALSWLLRKATSRLRLGPAGVAASTTLLAALLGISARGSLGPFPLGRMEMAVSQHPLLNAAAMNGPFAFFFAVLDYRNSFAIPRVTWEEGIALARQSGHFDQPDQARSLADLGKVLGTPSSIRKPNVVVVLMESMSGHLVDFHGPAMNLLGRLERHFREDFVFSHFLSGTDGTLTSLEALLFNSRVTPISDSPLQYHSFVTTAFQPFLAAGYDVCFVTAGSAAWRNLSAVLPRQGVGCIADQNAILAASPAAETQTWGVFDHEMFAYVKRLLNEAGERPRLVFALTTSNHSPFELPGSYSALPIQLTDAFRSQALSDEERSLTVLKNYQYSNDALGGFLDDLKASPLGARTLVAATGDHNARELLNYASDERLVLKHAVPFYLYLPPAYRVGVDYEPTRWGSHKDVFATLAARAVPGQKVFTLGNDLLASTADESAFHADHARLQVWKEGVVDLFAQPPVFFGWKSDLLLRPATAEETALLQSRLAPARALRDLGSWQIWWQARQESERRVSAGRQGSAE